LRAVDGADHLLQPAAGPDVKQGVQQRDLPGLGREQRPGQGPPADPVPRLHHDDVRAGLVQAARGGQPGQAGADDHDVALFSHDPG